MGTRSCGPLRSRVPALLDFSFAFRVPAFLYNIFFAFPCAPAFLCSCVNEHMVVQLITRPLSVYGWIRRAGQLTTVQCMSMRAGSQFKVKLMSLPQSPPSTSTLSTRHNCLISLQECELSFPILSRSPFPRSCIKFAFPRARVPKIPGTWEHGNAKPGMCAHL